RPVGDATTGSLGGVDPAERAEHALHRGRRPATLRRIRHTETIGLELRVAAVLQKHEVREQAASAEGRAVLRRQYGPGRERAARQHLLGILIHGVLAIDMADLMANHPG